MAQYLLYLINLRERESVCVSRNMGQYLLYLINLRERGCVWEYEAVPPEPDQPERVCVWEYDAVPPEIDQPEGQMVCLGIWGSGREVELGLLVHCSDFRKGLRVLRYI